MKLFFLTSILIISFSANATFIRKTGGKCYKPDGTEIKCPKELSSAQMTDKPVKPKPQLSSPVMGQPDSKRLKP